MREIMLEQHTPIVFGRKAESFEEAFKRLPTLKLYHDGRMIIFPQPTTNYERLKWVLWRTFRAHKQGEIIPLKQRMIRLTDEEMELLEKFSFRRDNTFFMVDHNYLSEGNGWLDVFCGENDTTSSEKEVREMIPSIRTSYAGVIFACLKTDQGENSKFDLGVVTEEEWRELVEARVQELGPFKFIGI